jgi:uncharacterized MAPEG superfamily protein
MEVYIILALVLALLQIWIIPMVLNSSNLEWMLSNREEVLDDSPVLIRSRKAYANLQETLPIFLALALLSMIKGIDVTDMACWWLVFRGVHGRSNLHENAFLVWSFRSTYRYGSPNYSILIRDMYLKGTSRVPFLYLMGLFIGM